MFIKKIALVSAAIAVPANSLASADDASASQPDEILAFGSNFSLRMSLTARF